jgi:hypothetical protein
MGRGCCDGGDVGCSRSQGFLEVDGVGLECMWKGEGTYSRKELRILPALAAHDGDVLVLLLCSSCVTRLHMDGFPSHSSDTLCDTD